MGLFQNQQNFAERSLNLADIESRRGFTAATRPIAREGVEEQRARQLLSQRVSGGFGSDLADDVIEQSLSDLSRSSEIERQKLASRAAAAGAFGGSRFGIAEAELGRNLLDQQARTSSGLRLASAELGENLARQREEDLRRSGGQERLIRQSISDADREELFRRIQFPRENLATRASALSGIPLQGGAGGAGGAGAPSSSLLDILQGGAGIASTIGAISKTPFGSSVGTGISNIFTSIFG